MVTDLTDWEDIIDDFEDGLNIMKFHHDFETPTIETFRKYTSKYDRDKWY